MKIRDPKAYAIRSPTFSTLNILFQVKDNVLEFKIS